MCHYDEVVRSVAGGAAGPADRQAELVSVGALPGGARGRRGAGGEGGDRAVNDDAAQRSRGKGKAMIAPGSPPA